MRKNVIILAVGLSGSSVLTALVNRVGYSVGSTTVAKVDYNTYENAELVRLNKKLLEATGSTDFGVVYDAQYIERMKALPGKIDDTEFRAFVDSCNAQQPWLWKDPRLTVTIHFWKHYLDLTRVQFIINDREPLQSWISWNLRRQIQSYSYAKRYSDSVVSAMHEFLSEHRLGQISVRYEALVCRPHATIARLNDFLGSELTVADLQRVYKGRLGKKTHGAFNFTKAALIYLKNYDQRYC